MIFESIHFYNDHIAFYQLFNDQVLFMTFAENVIENCFFTKAYRNYNFQVIKTELFKKIALFIIYS